MFMSHSWQSVTITIIYLIQTKKEFNYLNTLMNTKLTNHHIFGEEIKIILTFRIEFRKQVDDIL